MICISSFVCALFTLDNSFIFFSFLCVLFLSSSIALRTLTSIRGLWQAEQVHEKEEERQSILPRLSLDQVYWLSLVLDLSGYPAIASNVMVIAQWEKTCCFIRQLYLRQLGTYETNITMQHMFLILLVSMFFFCTYKDKYTIRRKKKKKNSVVRFQFEVLSFTVDHDHRAVRNRTWVDCLIVHRQLHRQYQRSY